ncbi:MAG TPA: TIGR03790 family protein [Verrucomicrobiota bacterium]|nr:TIGR03790 family protein [Verrucomicrobiota bacterium]
MNSPWRFLTTLLLAASAIGLLAGGSGLNVMVVVNTNSANSLQLGSYYSEKRSVPPQNVLRIGWTGTNTVWSVSQFESALLNPLLAAVSHRALTNQIEFVVLSMDIPYKTSAGPNDDNSTTSALFYGFKPDGRNPFVEGCVIASNSVSAYAGSERPFRDAPPISPQSNSFLATMITASNLALAKRIVDSGVLGDSTFPTQSVRLLKSGDWRRNIRYTQFDNAIFDTRLRGDYSMVRTTQHEAVNLGAIPGLQTGRDVLVLSGTTFLPGSLADSLTSFAGRIFENSGQTPLLTLLEAGAAGSYGTVMEPCAFYEKFPMPTDYFYQSRGFSLAECYYMSVTNPYQGLIVGEPLSATFAQSCAGDWINLPQSAQLSGTTNLSLQFVADDTLRAVQRVDLFVDGQFYQTLTNIAPADGNSLHVTINGFPTNYTVPPDATLQSVASNLSSRLNASGYRDATRVQSLTHGDRLELRSTNIAVSGTQVSISTSNDIGSATLLTTHLHTGRTNFLDTIAFGIRSFEIGIGVATNESLTLSVTKTNGANVTVSITNFTEGILLETFLNQFMSAINNTAALQGVDGLVAEDLYIFSSTFPEYSSFNLRARSAGWDAAQIQASITGPFDIDPPGNRRLDGNLADLQPRNHLYITAGLTNLAFDFPFDTTLIPDGWHELTAVAYEGSHVRTQTRITRNVLVQNTTLTASLDCLTCGTNGAFPLDGTLQFLVTPNTNTISRIELFSTGGSWGVVSNQPTAAFSIPATNLHLGLHPFHALVTRDDNAQYRTGTQWLRIYNPFTLTIAEGPAISWLAVTGQVYEVWSATNVTDAFALRDSFTATSTNAVWTDTNSGPMQQFYRVTTQP